MNPTGPLKLFDPMYAGLGNVLDLRRAQHTLTASNLANADTPGYLAKEIPFADLLTESMEAPQRDQLLDIEKLAMDELREIEAPAYSLDGNSVDAEREATRLAENQVMYEALAGGMSRRLAMLRFAASDGKM